MMGALTLFLNPNLAFAALLNGLEYVSSMIQTEYTIRPFESKIQILRNEGTVQPSFYINIILQFC